MYVVRFFENKNLLLTQLLKRIPSEGDSLTIKGRKGKVSSVNSIDEKIIHVQLIVENINKKKQLADPSKKKKR